MAPSKRTFVVLNPNSGRADVDRLRQLLTGRLDEHGWVYDFYEMTGDDDVAAVVRAACARGTELVIAAGGDGTVASVVNGVWQSSANIGILPAGTGNLLARALSIPNAVESALDLIVGDHALQALDLMQIGDQVFVLDVSAGLSARAMRDTRPEQKKRFGVLAYVWPIVRDLIRIQRRDFNLTIDGRRTAVRASEILVANGAFPQGEPKDFNDQQFNVYILSARSLPDYLRVIWGFVRGSWQGKAPLRTLTVRKSISIEAIHQPQPVQADGEPLGATPITVQLIPSAIHVIVAPRA
ncbi:MAG: diacylglycerol kinase family protein [Roseiflexaceae bacterium]